MAATRFWLILPLAILTLVVALLLIWRPFDRLIANAPPVENAKVDSVRLKNRLISLTVRTDGSEPVIVAQVQVDTGYRTFTATPQIPSAWLGLTRPQLFLAVTVPLILLRVVLQARRGAYRSLRRETVVA